MSTVGQMFAQLRKNIRQSGQTLQSSKSDLLPDDQTSEYVYDIAAVEQALDEFQASVAIIDEAQPATTETYNRLLKEAQLIAATSDDMQIRDFARSVAAFLVINHSSPTPGNPIRLVSVLDTINDPTITD